MKERSSSATGNKLATPILQNFSQYLKKVGILTGTLSGPIVAHFLLSPAWAAQSIPPAIQKTVSAQKESESEADATLKKENKSLKQKPGFYLKSRKGAIRKNTGSKQVVLQVGKNPHAVDSKSGFYSSLSDTDWEGLNYSESNKNWRFLTNGSVQFSIYEISNNQLSGDPESTPENKDLFIDSEQTQIEITKGEMLIGTSSLSENEYTDRIGKSESSELQVRQDIVISDPRFVVMLGNDSDVYIKAEDSGTSVYCLSGLCYIETTFEPEAKALIPGMGVFVSNTENISKSVDLKGKRLQFLYQRLMRSSIWWTPLQPEFKGKKNIFSLLKEAYLNGSFSKAMWIANRYKRKLNGKRAGAEASFMQGRIFKVIGDQKIARSFLSQAAKKDPTFAPSFVELADISIAENKFARARQELEKAEKGEFPNGELEPKKEYLKGIVHLKAREYFQSSNALTQALWFDGALPPPLRNPITELRARVRFEEGYRFILPMAVQYDSNPLWLESMNNAPSKITTKGTLRTLSGIILESDPFRFTSEPGRHHGLEASLLSLNHLTGGYDFLDTQILGASYKYAQRFKEPLANVFNYVVVEPDLQITLQKNELSGIAGSIQLTGAGTRFQPFLRYRPNNLVETSGGFRLALHDFKIFQDEALLASASTEINFERALTQFYASGNNILFQTGLDLTYSCHPRLSFQALLPSVTVARADWPQKEFYLQALFNGGLRFFLTPYLTTGLLSGAGHRYTSTTTGSASTNENALRYEATLNITGIF